MSGTMLPSFKLLSRHKPTAKILICVFPSPQNMIPSLDLWEMIPSAKIHFEAMKPSIPSFQGNKSIVSASPDPDTCMTSLFDLGNHNVLWRKKIGRAELLVPYKNYLSETNFS